MFLEDGFRIAVTYVFDYEVDPFLEKITGFEQQTNLHQVDVTDPSQVQDFVTTVINEGEEEEPRMGLYFPYGSPETMVDPRFPDPKEGDLMERSPDLHHWIVSAIDFDSGDMLWSTEVHSAVPDFDRHLKNTYASSTPVTDGDLETNKT